MSDKPEEVWREDAEALVIRIVADCADRNGELYDAGPGVEHVLSLVRCVLLDSASLRARLLTLEQALREAFDAGHNAAIVAETWCGPGDCPDADEAFAAFMAALAASRGREPEDG